MRRTALVTVTRSNVLHTLTRRLHLHHKHSLDLLQQASVPVVDYKVFENGKGSDVQIGQLGMGMPMTVRAEVILPANEKDWAEWPSGFKGCQGVAKSQEEVAKLVDTFVGKSVLSASSGQHGRPCSAVTVYPAGSTVCKLLLFASRKIHRPAVTLEVDGVEYTLALNIGSPRVDSAELEKFLKSAVDPTDIKGLKTIIQALWIVWRDNEVLRLSVDVIRNKANLEVSNPSILIDDFALFKRPDLKALADPSQELPLSLQAQKNGLFYHKHFGGNIAQYGYGAGVAMSTMDALTIAGGRPGNFLDGGGGATPANVRGAMELLLSDDDIDVIFVNSFGGITKTDLIAKGIVEIMRERAGTAAGEKTVIVRLRGTGEDEAAETLSGASDLVNVRNIKEMGPAADAAVAASLC